MLNVYCIPGMGVDERLYGNLKLHNCVIHPVKWITPLNNESLPDYAMRLSEQIDRSQPFVLIGVSYGGMCSAEIAKKLNPLKTFLISSCKTSDELPALITIGKMFPIYKFFSEKFLMRVALKFSKRFGITTKEEIVLFEKMLKASPDNYFKRAIASIIHWKEHTQAATIVHIHGTADRVLPFKHIKNCNYTIKDGTHWMVMNKAEEISRIINEELLKLSPQVHSGGAQAIH